MNEKRKISIVRAIHAIALIIWILISAIIWSLLLYIFRAFCLGLCVWLTRAWFSILVFLSGIRVTINGLDGLDRSKNYIFASNHSSSADIAILYHCLPFHISFLAKKELFLIPFFGWSMAVIGHIALDRKNPKRAKRSVERAVKILKRGKISLTVFPEGTRSRTGEMGTFKLGVFSLAIESGLDIVPIALKGTNLLLPKGAYFVNPNPVTVNIGKPISTSVYNRTEKKVLADLIREKIAELQQKN